MTKRVELANGAVVIARQVPGAEVAALQIWFKAGSVLEGEYMGSGISHFVEHMLFKGTDRRPVGAISREIERAGGVLNAFTSYENTVYHVTLPKENLRTGMDVFADAITSSTFDSEEMEKEREVILKEINMGMDDPDRYLFDNFTRTSFIRHPIRHPIIGYEGLFTRITRDDLLKYYRKMYIPDRMTVVAVGGDSCAEMIQLAKEFFEKIPRVTPIAPLLPPEPVQLSARTGELEYETQISRLVTGFHTVPTGHPDIFALDILQLILGGGHSSRLYQRLVEKEGLAFNFSCCSYTSTETGVFLLEAEFDYEKLDRINRVIREEIDSIKNKKVPEAELEKAKKQIQSHYLFQQEKVEGMAHLLGANEVGIGDCLFSEKYVKKVAKITSDDLQRIISAYFSPERMTRLVLKPKGAAGQDSQAQSADKLTEKITRTVLENGLRLIVRENPAVPVIGVKLLMAGGLRTENRVNNGISNLVAEMLTKGTASRTSEMIASQIESVGGRLGASSGGNSMEVSLSVMKDDFEYGLDILADVVCNASFPEKALSVVKEQIIADIKDDEDQPVSVSRNLLRAKLFPNHPYGLPDNGTIESVTGLKREELLTYYQRQAVPENMVMVLSGDIGFPAARESIKDKFGNLPGKKYPLLEYPEEAPITQVTMAEKILDKRQAVLMLGYRGMAVSDPDAPVFELLCEILSGMGGRLFDNVREKQGLAYFVGAMNWIGVDPGGFICYVGTVQEMLEAAKKSMLHEIQRLIDEPVDDEELSRARNNLSGHKKVSRQKNQAIALEIALDELYGLGYLRYQEYENRIKEISASDIQRVARQFLQSDSYICAQVVPPQQEEGIST
ncbi:MAG: M16 family metallopeptidase [bacterium]